MAESAAQNFMAHTVWLAIMALSLTQRLANREFDL